MFYFIRHGKTDYSQQNTKIYQGFGVNLAHLSELGVSQVKKAAKDRRLKEADIIISSPYTRALQTAAILSKKLDISIIVETDLHEWLSNKHYVYESDDDSTKAYAEYKNNQGNYPDGEERLWESAKDIRKRVLKVLNKYRDYKRVIVVGHGTMIEAVTGKKLKCAEIVEFKLID